MGEQGDVGVGDVPVGDSAVAAVPDVGFGEQVVLPGLDLRLVRHGDLPVAPHAWRRRASNAAQRTTSDIRLLTSPGGMPIAAGGDVPEADRDRYGRGRTHHCGA